MILLKKVRLSFPHLFKADAFNGEGTPKFSATFLIPKGSEAAEAIEKEIRAVATATFGDKAKGVVERQNASNRRLLKDGDTADGLDKNGDQREGWAGHLAIKGSNVRQPVVVGRDRKPITEEDGIIYGGCWVNAQLDIWAQKNQFGSFVNCKLLAVQFWEDGDSFGTAASADLSAFDEAAPTESEDTPW